MQAGSHGQGGLYGSTCASQFLVRMGEEVSAAYSFVGRVGRGEIGRTWWGVCKQMRRSDRNKFQDRQ